MTFYCFDFHGGYLGYLDGNGVLVDSRGKEWARLADDCRVYGLDGRCWGHVDAQGSLFMAQGSCRGYVRGWTHPSVGAMQRRSETALAVATPAVRS